MPWVASVSLKIRDNEGRVVVEETRRRTCKPGQPDEGVQGWIGKSAALVHELNGECATGFDMQVAEWLDTAERWDRENP